MRKLILSLSATTVFSLASFGQGIDDALRFSANAPTGTARSMAMGNAFGALGGDYSSIGINPAGIAVYRSGEATFTPSLIFNKTKSNFENIGREGDKTTFVPNQVAGVWTMAPMREVTEGIVSSSFSIGYQRTANFNQSGYIKGDGIMSSILDQFVFESNGYAPNGLNNFRGGLGYDMYLMDNSFNSGGSTITMDNTYFHAWQYPSIVPGTEDNPEVNIGWRASQGINQQRFYEQNGYKGEFNFAYGVNISNKLFLGGSANVLTYFFKEHLMHSEAPNGGLDGTGSADWELYDFAGFDYHTYLEQRATGFNLKLGAIYKPTHAVRIGLAYHTPSYYRVDEDYQSKMQVRYANPGSHLDDAPLLGYSPKGEDEYRFRTADRLVASIGVVVGNMLIVSADYERSNYGHMKYKSLSDQYRDYSDQNSEIRSALKAANTYRAGIEYKPLENIALRAGYSMQESPIKSSMMVNKRKFETYSLGAGYRMREYYVDVAYMLAKQQRDYYLYSWEGTPTGVESPPPAKMSISDHQVAVTVGYRF